MSRPVVIYVHDLRSSGVVVNAIALARRLACQHRVILAAGSHDGFFASPDLGTAELTILCRGRKRFPRLAPIRPLRALLRRENAAVVISNGNFGHMTVQRAARGLSLRKVFTVSNEIERGDWRDVFRRQAARGVARDADRLVFVGKTLADNPIFAPAWAQGRAEFNPNAVDLDRARSRLGAPPPHPWLEPGQPPVVLAIGRLNRQKNLDGLIRAMALVEAPVPPRLIVLGGGPQAFRQQLQALAARLGIADRVLLPGETDDVYAWLAHAALLALPSRWEGSSTALLEALAAGTPVVASRQAGDAVHVLGDGAYGVLVEAGDDADIARGIVHQLSGQVVRPGSRCEDFSLARSHDQFALMLSDLIPRT